MLNIALQGFRGLQKGLLFRAVVFLIEAFNATGCVDHLLFASEERVALRANFNVVIAKCGARFNNGTAGTRNFGGFIIRVNIFLHDLPLVMNLFNGAAALTALPPLHH
jgi:hypothetical protein